MHAPEIVAVVANPAPGSRTAKAAGVVAERVADLVPGATWSVLDLAEEASHLVEWGSPRVKELKERLVDATGVVVASPTFKATYTGLLKLFIDHFDGLELDGTPTVALMTGGNPAHALAVDVHLVPVLMEIGASCPARGLFLAGEQVDDPGPIVDAWLDFAGPVLTRALTA